MRANRYPTFRFDDSGVELATIPLAGSDEVAMLDAQDMNDLIAAAISMNWNRSKDGHVRVNVPGMGPVNIARMLIGAGKGERVQYLDRNQLNLRASNLRLHEPVAIRKRAQVDAFIQERASTRDAGRGVE
jgi:hypothetical protein